MSTVSLSSKIAFLISLLSPSISLYSYSYYCQCRIAK
jgi:hypothetical protein